MKIAQLVSTYPPYHGGMGKVAFQYATELANRGHQVTVFIPAGSRASQRDARFNHQVARIKPTFAYGNAAWLPGLEKQLADFDLVHLHYPFLGAESVLRVERPLLLTYHMDLVGQGWKKLAFNFYQKFFLPRLIERAAKVMFSSADYLDHSRAAAFKKGSADIFSVIPLGADQIFRPSVGRQSDIWSRLQVTQNRPDLFVSNLDKAHYFKGLNILFEAVAKLGRTDFALAVVGDGDMKAWYEQRARQLGLSNIYFLGRLDDQILVQCYQNCDFLVLPSIDSSEAYGLVVIEAFACGRPVIASALPGVRQLIEDGVDGLLVKPRDIAGLAQAIDRMLSMDRTEMGRLGYRKVEQFYRWPKIVEQIEQLYQSL